MVNRLPDLNWFHSVLFLDLLNSASRNIIACHQNPQCNCHLARCCTDFDIHTNIHTDIYPHTSDHKFDHFGAYTFRCFP
jgi:hypothetical protein